MDKLTRHNFENDVKTEDFNIKKFFASPIQDESNNTFAAIMSEAMKGINSLKPTGRNSSAFLGKNPELTVTRENARKAVLRPEGESFTEVLNHVISTFEGLPNWGHPLNMTNICPQENYAAIAASMLTQMFSPNILEAEYAWNTSIAELESSAMLADMAGWNSEKSGGICTYGGSGCWMYQLKYALSRVLPDSRQQGIRTDAKVLCSEQAHYAMLNSTDWTGLGMNNIIKINTLPDTNTMDITHLEQVIKECSDNHVPIASVVCTMATTDACAFDPVKKVRELIDRYPNNPEYGKALLYCDAVIGWSWLAFKDYDFAANPQNFPETVLESARKNGEAIREIQYADAFGVDFHKNFSPLISSVFVYKDRYEFEDLLKRESSAYLQERGDYNPHNYTLEVSRSAGGSMAAWATLKFLGIQGIQHVLAHGLKNKHYMLEQLEPYPDMTCINTADNGAVLLLRIYPEGTDAALQYQKELADKNFRNTLAEHNTIIEKTADLLWKWFREEKQIDGKRTPYLSITKGFRPAVYNTDPSDHEAVIYALKVYPVSPYITKSDMQHALYCIRMARNEVV
ncbi:aspartate aminotransferase family protein [Chryseobacterium sp. SN22]|uniref:pyridoxal phosphate-dependent decarboxylase family protein n=1 Tax=Chryseobacterium sp. SN22 TaxID=2606431 RepID=UPI0011ED27FD|nr:pyridoxal-dependent decarboxylase [Chryseobacterium sp. SN22]KAA0128397.1 aspartate aminotransferase family protein [Chryseobacterium sp. SN22]